MYSSVRAAMCDSISSLRRWSPRRLAAKLDKRANNRWKIFMPGTFGFPTGSMPHFLLEGNRKMTRPGPCLCTLREVWKPSFFYWGDFLGDNPQLDARYA